MMLIIGTYKNIILGIVIRFPYYFCSSTDHDMILMFYKILTGSIYYNTVL